VKFRNVRMLPTSRAKKPCTISIITILMMQGW
jgi:hypothetical protein